MLSASEMIRHPTRTRGREGSRISAPTIGSAISKRRLALLRRLVREGNSLTPPRTITGGTLCPVPDDWRLLGAVLRLFRALTRAAGRGLIG